MNRKVLLLGGLVLVALALGACGGAAFECEDAIGCVEIGPDEPIHLSYMLPETGGAAVYGIAAQGAFDVVTADRGQILDHDILITGEDSGCSAEGGETAAQRVAADPTIVGVIGTTCSSAMTAAMSTISEAGLTIISPSNTSMYLTEPGNLYQPGYFRTAHNDLFQGEVAAVFAFEELGVTTASVIHDGDPYTQGLGAAFSAAFENLGGTVIAVEGVNKGDTDMRPVLTSIASEAPEVLYFPVFQPEGDFIAAQSAEVAGLENTALFGADGLAVAPFAPSAGQAALGMYLSGPAVAGSLGAEFLAAYESSQGEKPPGPFGEHASDALNILLNAIESVAVVDSDGTVHIGRQALRDAVTNTSGFQGITGVLSCGPKELQPGVTYNGDCATGEALGVYQINQAWIDSEDAYDGLAGENPPLIWTK